MTGADPFAGVFAAGERPDAPALLALLQSQGYGVKATPDGPRVTRVKPGGRRDIAEAVAAVIGHEPYRSGVLTLCGISTEEAARPPPATPEPLPMVPVKADAPPSDGPAGEVCRVCRSWVFETAIPVTDVARRQATGEVVETGEMIRAKEVICGHGGRTVDGKTVGRCPYRRVTWGEPQAEERSWQGFSTPEQQS